MLKRLMGNYGKSDLGVIDSNEDVIVGRPKEKKILMKNCQGNVERNTYQKLAIGV